MSQGNILFYSLKCEACINLLTLMRNENLLCYFKLISVDNQYEKMLSMGIKSVPTMIVSTINKPLVCQETFKWVEQIKYIKQNQVMDINKKIIQQNMMNNVTKKGPIGYDDEIMGGLSDKFAFTKVDEPLPHAYFGLGDEDKNAIFTAPEQDKLSKDYQNKMIGELKSKRDIQDSDYINYNKQQQINAIVNSEKEKILQQQYNNNN